MDIQRSTQIASRQIAEKAVHMIASIEPALDAAIERFVVDKDAELARVPARETILKELCAMISLVAEADGELARAEIASYTQLLRVIDLRHSLPDYATDSRGYVAAGKLQSDRNAYIALLLCGRGWRDQSGGTCASGAVR